MSGGNRTVTRLPLARRWAASLLGGLLFSSIAFGDLFAAEAEETAPPAAEAAPAAAAPVGDCPARPDEKSIVVENGKVAAEDRDVALATDQDAGALQPIANVSEYEPDLAESAADRLEGALVPTLADPPESLDDGITPAAPIADDVCIEDEVAEQVTTDVEPTVELQAASFNGVTPGLTARAEVLSQWTTPLEEEVDGETLTYELVDFPTVAVGFNADVVVSIRIALAEPAAPQELIAKLGLADLRPAASDDEFGSPASLSFPERGVTLNFQSIIDDDSSSDESSAEGICEIVVRPIEAAPVLQRAESCPQTHYAHRLTDLETARKLDPANARILCRLSELKLAACQTVAAEELAASAVELAADSDECRLQWAKCLQQLARYDRAVEETRAVLDGTTAAPIVRAQALEQMALLAALGSKEVQERAMPLHTKAIELADSLAASENRVVAAAAHQVLLGAHLAMAQRIAAGDWQNKDEVVGQWIGRASALAEQMIVSGEGDVSLRLQVAVSALTAGARLQPPLDPKLWIAEAEQAAADCETTVAADATARDLLHWQLGLAYLYAAEIQHRRGEADLAIRYGEQADAALTPLAEQRADLPDTRYALGRLYFQIGAVHAVHRHDHTTACTWYDRGAESLLEPVPVTTLASPGQHGDALVSMGVSYWETGKRDRAYELTEAGVDLVTQGIAEGLLAVDALAVPQGNLNAMANALGKAELQAPATPSASGTRMAAKPRTAAKRSASRAANNESTRRR